VTLFAMMDSAAPDDQTKGLKRFRANAGTHGAFRGAISHSIFADGARELETVTRTGRGDDHTRIIGKVASRRRSDAVAGQQRAGHMMNPGHVYAVFIAGKAGLSASI
jgi:hypothetical protein